MGLTVRRLLTKDERARIARLRLKMYESVGTREYGDYKYCIGVIINNALARHREINTDYREKLL